MFYSKPLARRLFIAFLLAGWLAGILIPTLAPVKAGPQKAVAPGDIVISEFRTRGPAGASDEFIEIFNKTGGAIQIGGWKVRKSSGCGVTLSDIVTITSGTVLGSGEHYLVASDRFSKAATVTPNQTYLSASVSIADDGGIAIIDSTNIVIDQVGMCANTGYREPTELPAITSMTTDKSYERKPGGVQGSCNDTGNNLADFTSTLISPSDPQNSTSAPTYCLGVLTFTPTETPTSTPSPPTNIPTATFTSTPTPTATFTSTPTPTSTTALPLSIIINEVAWAGTAANSNDEWIELYNPGLNTVNLNDWHLFILDLNRNIVQDILLTGGIPAGGYYLLARSSSNTPTPPACVVLNSADVTIDKTFTASLSNSGAILELKDPPGNLVDTANSDGGSWPAGLSFNYSSMERRGAVLDSSTAWFTFAGSNTTTARDCVGNRVRGTPKGSNWAWTVTITPTPRPPKTATPRPPTPFGRMVINEFLPRAGFDWNNDGVIDVNDEFIEIENLGPVDVNLSGWKLDDEINTGSSPYTLPNKILKSGERAVFYGSMTNILLNDSGDSVRLINKSGVVVDARTYGVVKYPDQSHCRIPDGNGYWQLVCFPTPGNENALAGILPAPPPDKADQPAACLLPDTTPEEFRLAECDPFGADIWNRKYWDDAAGQNQFIVPDSFSKSQTIVE
ncbi:MAG: lamin tail domain-containing protein [Chloroflexi bacterium]|nr:lamin tail domain-containing protein [Chloroflexota bacterium]